MNTLAEIKAIADSLPDKQKEDLPRFFAMGVHQERTPPTPRVYSDEELAAMVAEGETTGAQFRQTR